MSNTKQQLEQLESDPRVSLVDKDEEGYVISLAPGFLWAKWTPFITEGTLAQCLIEMRRVAPKA